MMKIPGFKGLGRWLDRKSSPGVIENRFTRAATALILGTAVFLGVADRLIGARQAFLFGDEFHSLKLVFLPWSDLLGAFDRMGSGLVLPVLQKLGITISGFSQMSIRWPALAGGLGVLAFAAVWTRRRFGSATAVLAAGLLALSPFQSFYSHYGRIYALSALGTLGLVAAAHRLLKDEAPRWPVYLVLAAGSTVLPWLHLTNLSIVGSVWAACAVALRRDRRRLIRFLVCAASGAILCLAVYAACWTRVMAYVKPIAAGRFQVPFSAIDVLVLGFGGVTAAACLVPLAVLGLIFIGRRDFRLALLFLAVLSGPVIGLLAARPFGDAYAYTRYLLPSFMMATIAGANGAARLVARCGRWRRLGLAAAALAVLLGFGPLMRARQEGPYANCYLTMLPLSAFDRAPEPHSRSYDRFAAEPGRTVIEAPAVINRSLHLYRAYFRLHHRRTLLAFPGGRFPSIPSGPYIEFNAALIAASGADYLIVHKNAAAEVSRFWASIYDRSASFKPRERAFLERHRWYGIVPGQLPPGVLEDLRSGLGAPIEEDNDVVVWRLPGRRGRPATAD